MELTRRNFLAMAGRTALAGSAVGLLGGPVRAAARARVAIAVPGPGNLLFLPITLADKIGADEAEGLDLDIRYIGGGPQAYRDMLERNSDFSAGGMAALALQKLSGKPVVCVAPMTRVPAYTLLVRSSLKGKVKSISDLAGKVIGVKGHVPGGRSTSQLFTEHVLMRSGVGPDRANYVSVGQAYDNQHAALATGTVDALMGDEPFATRLVKQKAAYVLADYHDLETTRRMMGGLFLNGQVATREDFAKNRPEVVEKMVKTLKRTLVWIDKHSAREMVDALALPAAEEREALHDVLKLRKKVYSPDGRFSAEQLATVDHFLHSTETSEAARAFSVSSIVQDRWAGKAP
jgi:ABC-type nitrate/sulfonate/bicarbonate transport system substrate-binding protein